VHRALTAVVCQVLGWDIEMMPRIVFHPQEMLVQALPLISSFGVSVRRSCSVAASSSSHFLLRLRLLCAAISSPHPWASSTPTALEVVGSFEELGLGPWGGGDVRTGRGGHVQAHGDPLC
jgi:hypothetical protein